MGILTDSFTNTWADALQSALLTPLQHWLTDHPLMAWLVVHPLWGLALVGVSLLLFAGLWSAIARLTEGFWLALVRFPFWLGSGLFMGLSQFLAKRWATPPPIADPNDRLGEIIGRLETLQIEQEGLLAEMRQLLAERQ